jgi:predicted membrane-bound dolichyl-phosphate-mannose-protein mannosyltransferase
MQTITSAKLDFNLKNLYDRLFLILFAVDLVLRVIWLDKPAGSLIFDEYYYVNVARVILRLPQSPGSNGQPPYVNAIPGLDPNHEHPPLAKLLIALSMYLLGDNAYGWRIPSVIFGAVAILVFYLLMKKTSKFKQVPIIATFLFSFDTLGFVLSRIAILDIFMLTFMLLGFYWYFTGHSWLSAFGMALASLAKITGIAGFGIIIVVHALKCVKKRSKTGTWKPFLSWFEKYFVVFLVSFLVILTVLDRLWVGYSNPFDHLGYMLSYSTGLVSACPNGIISCPWQWLVNQVQIPYFVVNVQVPAGTQVGEYESIAFMGMMNPTILYLTIPGLVYLSYHYFHKMDDFSSFILIWFAATYFPYLPAVIFGHRVSYIFYFLPAMPAVCAAVAHMITDQNPPRLVVLFYLAVVLGWFINMFPFKVFPT